MPTKLYKLFSHNPSKDTLNTAPTPLPQQRLKERLLLQGITAFEAGLNAKQAKEANPQRHFAQAADSFRQSIKGQADDRTLALAYGYLALIRFDGLDGKDAQKDINTIDEKTNNEAILRACQSIDSLSKEDGLKDIPQDFKNHFENMIGELYEMRPEYNGNKWSVRLITEQREYREKLSPEVGAIEARKQADKHYDQRIADISTINTAVTLLKETQPSVKCGM